MSPRFWIFLAAISGGLSVIAGAIGAHSLPETVTLAVPIRIFNTAQLYHALHSLALLGTGIVLLATEERRASWSGWVLQAAALAFALGTICFSGGIYVQIARGFGSSAGIVPFGGACLIAGWGALAVGVLGVKSSR